MRKTHLACCVSNRSGVLVRVGLRMDPMCWESGSEDGSDVLGRVGVRMASMCLGEWE